MLAQRVVKFETIRALEASLKEKSSAMAAATISAEEMLSREKERAAELLMQMTASSGAARCGTRSCQRRRSR